LTEEEETMPPRKKAPEGAMTTRKAPTRRRRQAVEPATRGLEAAAVTAAAPPPEVADLTRAIAADGGAVIGAYRDPLGGFWHVLGSLPLEKLGPTPFQRDLSAAHVKRLHDVMEKMGRFLDPVIAVRNDDGTYWTPNGHHRTAALRAIGGRSIVALVLPDRKVAYQILALNTEKAHNLREKALEVIRMARDLAGREQRPEQEYALEFEEAALLTLGVCYEQRGRFSGGAYHPALRRVDELLADPLPQALEVRAARAARVLALDDAVEAAIEALKRQGFESPYLRAFVVARVNPLRFHQGAPPSFDATLDRMLEAARRFDASKIKHADLARTGGAPDSE
jgi:ParB family chromosome partitioning protein